MPCHDDHPAPGGQGRVELEIDVGDVLDLASLPLHPADELQLPAPQIAGAAVQVVRAVERDRSRPAATGRRHRHRPRVRVQAQATPCVVGLPGRRSTDEQDRRARAGGRVRAQDDRRVRDGGTIGCPEHGDEHPAGGVAGYGHFKHARPARLDHARLRIRDRRVPARETHSPVGADKAPATTAVPAQPVPLDVDHPAAGRPQRHLVSGSDGRRPQICLDAGRSSRVIPGTAAGATILPRHGPSRPPHPRPLRTGPDARLGNDRQRGRARPRVDHGELIRGPDEIGTRAVAQASATTPMPRTPARRRNRRRSMTAPVLGPALASPPRGSAAGAGRAAAGATVSRKPGTPRGAPGSGGMPTTNDGCRPRVGRGNRRRSAMVANSYGYRPRSAVASATRWTALR